MSGTDEPQVLSAWVRRSLEEVGAFATDEVLEVFQEAAGDQAMWKAPRGTPPDFSEAETSTFPKP